jgi:Tfp pilus assembly protein FimT
MQKTGTSLIELLVALTLLAGILAIALPPAGRWRDAAAVRGARDELAAALSWTRMAAAARGGATLVLDPTSGRFWTEQEGRHWRIVDLAGHYGVRIETGTSRPVAFRYDGLGIGRVASRTVRIHRSGAEAGITVSSYGRVRRW